jgi:hypothetical protein
MFYMNYTYYPSHNIYSNPVWDALAVVFDDNLCVPLALEDPAWARTPPTPPVVPSPQASAYAAPLRQRAMAHLRPVSMPDRTLGPC